MSTLRTDEELRSHGVIDEERGGMVNTDFARELERELNRTNKSMEHLRAWASKMHDELQHQSQLRQEWHDLARELANELDWRFGQDSWRNPKSATGIALARFNAMEKSAKE